ncbi:MAG TPA: DUF2680 domain-containing protein [Candidatus Acetothermia bacterium]|nr:DUF2680 domain-containing protein [Candidatus Acetothermia bacterium]
MINRSRAVVKGLAVAVAATSVAFVVLGQAETETAIAPREGLWAKVAANLGVSVDDLVAAFTKARVELVDEAVVAGRITAEQAQAMKDRIEARQALRDALDQAIAAGRITRDQLALVRGPGRGMLGRERVVLRGFSGWMPLARRCR